MNNLDMTLRRPTVDDGADLHRLIASCPPLDVNSRYAYLIICRDFADTSVVASNGRGELCGAITAYRPQAKPHILFVWQVAVQPTCRGQGLAHRMLRHLLQRQSLLGISWVEATVGPDNRASRNLFAGLAAERAVRMTTTPLFDSRHLGEGHEPELLHRVGPLHVAALRQAV